MNKNKKIFSMILIFMGMICVLCMTGCNFSCFGFKCSNVNNDDFKFVSVTVPGLGGCLSPGKGCNSCLYTDSCVYSCGKIQSSDTETLSLMGCNQVFYGSCFGCGTSPRAVYNGCIDSPSVKGCSFGTEEENGSNKEINEQTIGRFGNCVGCFDSKGTFHYGMTLMENLADVMS